MLYNFDCANNVLFLYSRKQSTNAPYGGQQQLLTHKFYVRMQGYLNISQFAESFKYSC